MPCALGLVRILVDILAGSCCPITVLVTVSSILTVALIVGCSGSIIVTISLTVLVFVSPILTVALIVGFSGSVIVTVSLTIAFLLQ